MNSAAGIYGVVLTTFAMVVLIMARLLHMGRSLASLVSLTCGYLLLVAVLLLFAARMDLYWLTPEQTFSSGLVLVIPSALVFGYAIWFFTHARPWQAALIAVTSHVAAILAADIAILGL